MWKPTDMRIIVRFDEEKEAVTAGGVILAGKAEESPNKTASVVAVGRNVRDVVVGDRVVFSGYAGSKIPERPGVRLITEADVLAVVYE